MGPNKILNLSIVCRRFPCPVPPMTAQRSRKQGMSNWQKWVLHQMSKPRVYHQLKPKVLADWTSRILCKHSKERHEPTCKQSNIYVSVLFVSAFLLLYFWVLSFCIASWLILFSYFIVFISHVYNMIAFRLCFHYLHVLVVLQSWIDRCGTCLIWSEIRSAITAIFLFSHGTLLATVMPRKARIHLVPLHSSLVNLPMSMYGPLVERDVVRLSLKHSMSTDAIAASAKSRSSS